MPLHWQLWLMLLVAANLVASLFFLHRLEAQVVLGTMLASMMLMTLLTARFGFTQTQPLEKLPNEAANHCLPAWDEWSSTKGDMT